MYYAVYFCEISKYFKQYLADHRFFDTPPVESVRTDDAAEFMSGYFADLCRGRGIWQESTKATNSQFNIVTETGIPVIASTGKATSIQTNSMFSCMGIPLSDSLWAA